MSDSVEDGKLDQRKLDSVEDENLKLHDENESNFNKEQFNRSDSENATLRRKITISNVFDDNESFKDTISSCFNRHIHFDIVKDRILANSFDFYYSLSKSIWDQTCTNWIKTKKAYREKNPKKIFYFSLEFLMGRTLMNTITNMKIYEPVDDAISELGLILEDLEEQEPDAGLGNGGLGRLAACFLDSMATLSIPAYGFGIRYDYGIFDQDIKNGWQVENPDNWLENPNPWEVVHPEKFVIVEFFGRTYFDEETKKFKWVDTVKVKAIPYDTPIPGYGNKTCNTLRLYSCRAISNNFQHAFNDDDYLKLIKDRSYSEEISKVLYPNDCFFQGKKLRLRQQYFLVSAGIQTIVKNYLKGNKLNNGNSNDQKMFENFPSKIAIQLNDTHPALAIPELMHILIDKYSISWKVAWEYCTKTFAYTNHTVLPEALECWNVDLMGWLLPRHMEIIFNINFEFLEEVKKYFPNDWDRLKRMSIIIEGNEKKVNMAHLAIIGSHTVNGVSALHSKFLKDSVFKDFAEMWPKKFQNKTNGITPRRWLLMSNSDLATLIKNTIGDSWIKNLDDLKKLKSKINDNGFLEQLMEIKKNNKVKLARIIERENGVKVDCTSLFDIQVKRIHEYKRQLLNILHVITLYNKIKRNPDSVPINRTIIIAGKAAPGYHRAKLIIKLFNSVCNKINNDPSVNRKLKCVFMKNYRVTLAQTIIPAADLSEQISLAGTEASGTGNMKFMLNGSLTIGTLDGANVEMSEEVGRENIFIFGLNIDEVQKKKESGYKPWEYYERIPELHECMDQLRDGYFNQEEPGLFREIFDSLVSSDFYLVLADYESYINTQREVENLYKNQYEWTRKSLLNIASTGKFSSDRTINEYAKDIWNVQPLIMEH